MRAGERLGKKPVKRDDCDSVFYNMLYILLMVFVVLKVALFTVCFAFAANVLQHIYYAMYLQDTRILQHMIHI